MVGVDGNYSCGLVVEVETGRRHQYEFNFNGQYQGYQGLPQCLFWDEVKIDPPKPKKGIELMFDPKKPYARRDGKFALIIHIKADGSLIVLDEDEDVYYCFSNGKYVLERDNEFDLVNIPQKIEGWLNIYKGDIISVSRLCKTKNEADDVNLKSYLHRIACQFVSFIEGDGIDK